MAEHYSGQGVRLELSTIAALAPRTWMRRMKSGGVGPAPVGAGVGVGNDRAAHATHVMVQGRQNVSPTRHRTQMVRGQLKVTSQVAADGADDAVFVVDDGKGAPVVKGGDSTGGFATDCPSTEPSNLQEDARRVIPALGSVESVVPGALGSTAQRRRPFRAAEPPSPAWRKR